MAGAQSGFGDAQAGQGIDEPASAKHLVKNLNTLTSLTLVVLLLSPLAAFHLAYKPLPL
jgi:hypothetical protein